MEEDMVKRFLDGLEKAVKAGCIVSFSIMAIMGVLQVIFRYVIGQSLAFSEELARYMFVWAVFLGSAICLRKNSHAAIEIFVNWMPRGVQKVTLIIANFCCILFFALVVVKGIEITRRTWEQSSATLGVPMSLAYAAVPVGGILLFIYALEGLFNLVWPEKGLILEKEEAKW